MLTGRVARRRRPTSAHRSQGTPGDRLRARPKQEQEACGWLAQPEQEQGLKLASRCRTSPPTACLSTARLYLRGRPSPLSHSATCRKQGHAGARVCDGPAAAGPWLAFAWALRRRISRRKKGGKEGGARACARARARACVCVCGVREGRGGTSGASSERRACEVAPVCVAIVRAPPPPYACAREGYQLPPAAAGSARATRTGASSSGRVGCGIPKPRGRSGKPAPQRRRSAQRMLLKLLSLAFVVALEHR